MLRSAIGNLETQESQWSSSSPDVDRLETPQRASVSCLVQRQENPHVSAPGKQTGRVPSYLHLVLVG